MTLISYILTSFIVGTITTFSNQERSVSADGRNVGNDNEGAQNGQRSLMTTLNADDRLSTRDERLLKELVDALNAPVPSLDSTVRLIDSPVPSDSHRNVDGKLHDGPSGKDSGFYQKKASVLSVSNNDKVSVQDSKSNPKFDFNQHNEKGVSSDEKTVTNEPSMENQSDDDTERLVPPSEETPLNVNESPLTYEQNIKNGSKIDVERSHIEGGTDSIQKDIINEPTEDVLSQKDGFYNQQERDMENASPPEEPIDEEYLPTNTEEGLDSKIKEDADVNPLETIPDAVKSDFVDNSEELNSENPYRDPDSASDEMRVGTGEYNNNDSEETDGNGDVFSRNNDGDDDENNVYSSDRVSDAMRAGTSKYDSNDSEERDDNDRNNDGDDADNNDYSSDRPREDSYVLQNKRLDYLLNNLRHKRKHLNSLDTFDSMSRDRSRYNSANDY